jgi:hypothetical protein
MRSDTRLNLPDSSDDSEGGLIEAFREKNATAESLATVKPPAGAAVGLDVELVVGETVVGLDVELVVGETVVGLDVDLVVGETVVGSCIMCGTPDVSLTPAVDTVVSKKTYVFFS